MADPRVVAMIAKAAKKAGVDPAIMLATSLTENGARMGLTPGDNGTSFGAFQWHRGGALGNNTPEWTQTQDAFDERARAFAKYGVKAGKGAAAVQRPADRAGYEIKVNNNLSKARGILKMSNGNLKTQDGQVVRAAVPSKASQTAPAGLQAPGTSLPLPAGGITAGAFSQAALSGLGWKQPGGLGLVEQFMQRPQAQQQTVQALPLPDGTDSSVEPGQVKNDNNDVPTTAGVPGRAITLKSRTNLGGMSAHMARAIGNWQSDRAVDIGAPVGTPVYATMDGVVTDRYGALNSSDPKMAGLRLNVKGKGNSSYYAHLSKLIAKPGQRVKKGDLLGLSGSANGANHLHYGQEKGDPNAAFK